MGLEIWGKGVKPAMSLYVAGAMAIKTHRDVVSSPFKNAKFICAAPGSWEIPRRELYLVYLGGWGTGTHTRNDMRDGIWGLLFLRRFTGLGTTFGLILAGLATVWELLIVIEKSGHEFDLGGEKSPSTFSGLSIGIGGFLAADVKS